MENPVLPALGEDRPLAGLRVVELASVLAGPLVGSFLAELGAEVVKVENPRDGGDVTRQWRLDGESETGPSAYYVAANAPKEGVMLDLASESGREQLSALLAGADFLIQNFRERSLERLGLTPESISKAYPGLIHIHLKGFLDDPERAGYDMVVQAETGFMSMNGTPGEAPFRMPVAMMDILAAHQMRSAAMLALWQRERDGQGSYIETWLDASGMSALANRATEWLVAGREPRAAGALHPQIAPYGEQFTCSCGGQVVLSIGNDRQFAGLCALLGQAWHQDDRFSTNPARVKHRTALADLLSGAMAETALEDLMRDARTQRIPLGRLRSVPDALASPVGRAMTATSEQEGHGVSRVRQVAFRIHRSGSLTT